MFTFDVPGLRDLQAALDALENALLSEELQREAMMTAAQPLAALAASKVARGTRPSKRRLAESLRVGHPRLDVTRARARRVPPGTLVIVGSTSARARFEEYGTYRQAARPFLRPAIEQDRAALVARFAANLREILIERGIL